MRVEQRQHGLEHGAADVLEIDVDALRASGGEPLAQPRLVVIQAGIEAEFLNGPVALCLAAGNADGTAALDLRNLTDHRTDRARGGGHHHGLAGLGLADVEQTHVRREARHAEYPEREGGSFQLLR